MKAALLPSGDFDCGREARPGLPALPSAAQWLRLQVAFQSCRPTALNEIDLPSAENSKVMKGRWRRVIGFPRRRGERRGHFGVIECGLARRMRRVKNHELDSVGPVSRYQKRSSANHVARTLWNTSGDVL